MIRLVTGYRISQANECNQAVVIAELLQTDSPAANEQSDARLA